MFHAHVYFALNNVQGARDFHAQIRRERSDVTAIFPLVERLVGPHKMPMFELHFEDNSKGIIEWLDENRGKMPVLIHPVSHEHLLDHTERAIWLGQELGIFEETLS
ncbi:DOPA 4,5-dioxygenase family protein [Vibrio nigripulchritudo]|uniref:DOPA 4,5-dioxygenase family protein n=1 Tax=Vibrio nigripulchritudo TaxID=28173 RepID=UPI002491730E|nr:DOPA 4,5-dioxygenase family protein [Vibrio nigripulchritudo]BDU39739.1 DOPA 4,5-dioxygenase [Vibrio nigripulchritudo]BDU45462.1 DOPA 4,5-dioxygenase [Vibrio nigripulchritudo]